MLKVGDTIYRFDPNHRVYRKDESGRPSGAPIFEEYFVPFVIAGETKQSWLSGYSGTTKVNKKTLHEAGKGGLAGYQWYTAEGKADRIWLATHQHKIVKLVERGDADQLKRIAVIVGYDYRA